MSQEKKLSNCTMIMLKLDLKLCTKPNREQGILSPKKMLQRLPVALAQVKASNNLENLFNEIRQIVYSLYQSKEIAKKVYNNIIKSMQKCILYL